MTYLSFSASDYDQNNDDDHDEDDDDHHHHHQVRRDIIQGRPLPSLENPSSSGCRKTRSYYFFESNCFESANILKSG